MHVKPPEIEELHSYGIIIFYLANLKHLSDIIIIYVKCNFILKIYREYFKK